MKHKILLSLSLLIIAASCFSQKIEPNSLQHLAILFEMKINEYDKPTKVRKPETFLMFLEIDSAGSVRAIHMMSDDEVRDSSYVAVKKVSPADLKEWQNPLYASKIIIMPLNTYGKIDSRVNGKIVQPEKNYLRQGIFRPFLESADWKTKQGSSYIMGPNILYEWTPDLPREF
jgi:hypothetical protein